MNVHLSTQPVHLSPQQQQRATTPHSLPLSLAGELCVTCIANETTSCRLLCHPSLRSRMKRSAPRGSLKKGSTVIQRSPPRAKGWTTRSGGGILNRAQRCALDKDPHLNPLPCSERGKICHSERSEESRIFLDANHCTLNHGSTAAKAGGSKVQCVGKSGIPRFAPE